MKIVDGEPNVVGRLIGHWAANNFVIYCLKIHIQKWCVLLLCIIKTMSERSVSVSGPIYWLICIPLVFLSLSLSLDFPIHTVWWRTPPRAASIIRLRCEPKWMRYRQFIDDSAHLSGMWSSVKWALFSIYFAKMLPLMDGTKALIFCVNGVYHRLWADAIR